ncbi:MAG TPA: YggS family pyridoxal phosphate-dependent enzyme [Gemmatimonadaceae bacterium]
MAYSDLAGRVAEVRERIAAARGRGGHGQDVTLVAVTKTHGADAVVAAFEAGVPDVGENRVQEALRKMPQVNAPVAWHLIGHLQRNKVREATKFALIHSLDSLRLAGALDAIGSREGRPLDVLLQVNASREASKGGFEPSAVAGDAERLLALRGIRVRGVMTMAAFDAAENELRRTFGVARDALRDLARAGHPAIELSMGMSQDYEIAVEEGATMVRLGTTLFGPRGD